MPVQQSTSFFSFSILILTTLGALVGALLSYPLYGWIFGGDTAAVTNPYGYAPQGWCNVLAVQIHGGIVATQSEIPVTDMIQVTGADGSMVLQAPNYVVANSITDALSMAKYDPTILAVLVDVDSPGGGPVASMEIGNAIKSFGKPSVSVIHEMGWSGGYWIASAAQKVFAYPASGIGSIGVTSSYLSNVEKNKKEGLSYEQ